MLKTPDHEPASTFVGHVHIDVASSVVRLALSYVSEERGWDVRTSMCSHDCHGVRVIDRHHLGDQRAHVLVTEDRPARCQEAIEAVLARLVRAVVLWDDPGSLVTALEGIERGVTVIPDRVIELARDTPLLTARHQLVLRLLSAGRSNAEISKTLHLSTSTTKRAITELLELFDASSRAGLAARASRLGFISASPTGT